MEKCLAFLDEVLLHVALVLAHRGLNFKICHHILLP
jgi:hypothetical protein